jgi:adenosylhomocysteine nucleosidase
MNRSQDGQAILVCFAIKEEASPFLRFISGRTRIEILTTGMGQKNAERAFRQKIKASRPAMVLTCGFAGGLNPELNLGDVVFSADNNFSFAAALVSAKALPARFHFSSRIASTAEEKKALRQLTEADAVEMESGIIRAICAERSIPSATVRVISDVANENLPLDFNQLMTSEYNLDYGKLLKTILISPGKIGGLLNLQRQTKKAAANLSTVLRDVLRDTI